MHVYMHCPLYTQEGVAKHQVKMDFVLHFLEFLDGNPVAFAFPDSVALSLSEGGLQRKGWRKRGAPPDGPSSVNTWTAGTPAEGPNSPPPSVALPLGQHNVGRVSCNRPPLDFLPRRAQPPSSSPYFLLSSYTAPTYSDL